MAPQASHVDHDTPRRRIVYDHQVGEDGRSERRRAQRVAVDPEFAESDARTTTPLYDLSRSGALVATDQLFPLGARIELRFVASPADARLFVHTGVVTRHVHELPGMAVAFDAMSPSTSALLDELIAAAKTHREERSGRRARVVLNASELRTRLLDTSETKG